MILESQVQDLLHLIKSLIIVTTLIYKIPPALPLPSGPEALLGRRQKGGIPLFGKEGLREISRTMCPLNYGLIGNSPIH